jgi:hypothetical protein
MANDPTTDHLTTALRILADAQTAANLAASESYMRDIPAGTATRYARAACRADRINVIRGLIRELLDHPPHRPRAVASGPAELPADAA